MSCPTVALSEAEILAQLKHLVRWRFHQNSLERVYDGKSYVEALEKLNTIAQLSEAENHHPDLILSWKKLTIRYWTHTAQGVTELDFKLARQAESVLSA